MKMKNKLTCNIHGERKIAFVCQHLINGVRQGFWEPFDSNPAIEYESEELNAWCKKCDKILNETGMWNNESEKYANIQLVCDKCFFKLKKENKLNPNNNG